MMRGITNFLRERQTLKRFCALAPEDRDIVFYAESESYWPYMADIIGHLTGALERSVAYLTSSPSDPVLSDPPHRLRAFNIGMGTVRTLAFATLDAHVAVMTALDLGTSYIKRSRRPVHYVFVPHNMASTHMVFRRAAHNGFDTIFCTGPHQTSELREAETLYRLKPRDLVNGGYVRLDQTVARATRDAPPRGPEGLRVLIAPTWGRQALVAFGCEALIENLLGAGIEVILRPHRDSYTQDAARLASLQARFGAHRRFHWARDMPPGDDSFGAHALVTARAGASLSFAFGCARPVLSIDVPRKINNKDFLRFASVPLEVALREEIGSVLAPEDMDKASSAIAGLCAAPERTAARLRELRGKWVYRLGDAAEFAACHIAELADRRRAQLTR